MISDKIVLHTFMAGHTITAIIKKENQHFVTDEELVLLLAKFDDLNSMTVPRAGARVKIPILQRCENKI